MSFDLTGVAASVVVSGVDLRQACGFEAQVVSGRDGLDLQRRFYTAPTRNGVISDGGRFDIGTITVSGRLPRENVDRLRRILARDVSVPSHSARAKYIQFYDDPDKVYIFDTVSTFAPSPLTQNWGKGDDVAVTFAVSVVDAVGSYQAPASFGVGDEAVIGSSTTQNFLVAISRDGRAASGFDDGRIRARVTAETVLVSAERGVIADFDRTLQVKGVEYGLATTAFKMYAPQNLLEDGEFDRGAHAAWIATGCTKALVGEIVDQEGTGTPGVTTGRYTRTRILSGEYALKLTSVSNGDTLTQAPQLTASVEYRLLVESFFPACEGITVVVRVKDGLGATIIEKTLSTAYGEWCFEEFVFTAGDDSHEHTIEFACTSHTGYGTTFWLKRVVLAASLVTDGDLESGATGLWTASGATLAIEGTTKRTGAYSIKVTSSGDLGYVHPGAIGLTSGSLYYLSGWARRVSGTGDLILLSGAAVTGTAPACPCRLVTGSWVRFSTPFYSSASGSQYPAIVITTSGTVVLFDDVSVVELLDREDDLKAEGGIHYEPGMFGFRLQVPIGECLLVGVPGTVGDAATNPGGMAMHCQVHPMLFQRAGCGLLASAFTTGQSNCVTLGRDTLGVCGFYGGGSSGLGVAPSLATANAVVTALRTPARGALGVCLRYNYIDVATTQGLVVGVEARQDDDEDEPSFDQALSTAGGTSFPASDTFTAVMLGDGVAWDAFWVTEYPPSDDQLLAEMLAAEMPPMRNRWLKLLAAGNYLVDLKNWTVESYDHDNATLASRLANAWSSACGDMLKFYGEHPVIFSSRSDALIQLLSRRAP